MRRAGVVLRQTGRHVMETAVRLNRCLLVVACLLAACSTQIADQPVATDHANPPEAQAPMRPVPPPEPEWRVFGTEPFWSVHAVGSHLLFSTPDNPEGIRLEAKHSLQGGVEHFDSLDGSNGFELDLQRQACSDGMSDDRHEWTARFRYGGVEYKGCAKKLK